MSTAIDNVLLSVFPRIRENRTDIWLQVINYNVTAYRYIWLQVINYNVTGRNDLKKTWYSKHS